MTKLRETWYVFVLAILATSVFFVLGIIGLAYTNELAHFQACKYLGGTPTVEVGIGSMRTHCIDLPPGNATAFGLAGAFAEDSQYPLVVILAYIFVCAEIIILLLAWCI